MCGFDGVQRGNSFGVATIRRTEIETRVRKLKNGEAAGKDKVLGKMIKGGGNIVVNCVIWPFGIVLCLKHGGLR